LRAPSSKLPRWVPLADRVLLSAGRTIATLTRSTATNFRAEQDRMTASWAAGERIAPDFEYDPPRRVDPTIRRALDEIDRTAALEGELGGVYAARARELLLEADIASAIGTPDLARLVRERYGHAEPGADELSLAWTSSPSGSLASAEHAEGAVLVRSDDASDARSLVCQMRAEIGRRKLPTRIAIREGLAPLAACGAGIVHVATGRMIDQRAGARTVLHEIEGHVLPEIRSAHAELGILSVGTSRGSDDQEGYALVVEQRGGFLDDGRRTELGLRHIAARMLHEGGSFVDACSALLERGASVPDAVRIAMRAHRGGMRGEGGLGRERVYISAFLRVEACLREAPSMEAVLASGKVAVDAAAALAPWVSASASA
jgi:hypothetical protein